MSNQPAAIKATFSDFRLIRGRKCAQLVLEIPIEEADAALSVLGGIPQPHSERWVGVARLNGSAKRPGPKERQKWEDLKLSMQASIRCNETAFWLFLSQELRHNMPLSSDHAARIVRTICGVESRSGLNDDPTAAQMWRDLDRSYQAWLKVAE